MKLQTQIAPIVFVLSIACSAQVQTTPPDTRSPSQLSAALPSKTVESALWNVQSTTAALDISRWKAPGEVRAAAQDDVDSIQRDLGNTLPGLLARADASPGSVSPSFALYRNVDALYDVLLRVSQTADIAAPSDEASSVASALQKLEEARSHLGDAILGDSRRQESQIVALESEVKNSAAPTAPPQETETIIDDGPVKAPAKSTRRKSTPKNPATKPPAGTPATPSG